MIVADHGQGYAWSPPSLTISVGDTVRWSWEAPLLLNTGYRVFSVSSPSGTTYEGGAFNSGDAKTAKGESQPNSSGMNLGLRFTCSKITCTKHNKMTKIQKLHYLQEFCFKAFIRFTVGSFGKIQLADLLFPFSQRFARPFKVKGQICIKINCCFSFLFFF